MTYDELRHFADSWGLVAMGIMFLILVGWNFRRGARSSQERAARSILEEDDG